MSTAIHPLLRRSLLAALLVACGPSPGPDAPSSQPAGEAAPSTPSTETVSEAAEPEPAEPDEDCFQGACGLACPNGVLVQPPCEPCRCEDGPSVTGRTPTVEPTPQTVEATPQASPDENATGCQVELRTRVRALDDGRFAVAAVARNRTNAPLVFHFRPRCPGGAVTFQGLRPGYDFYGTCTMGACMPQPLREVRVSAGASTTLAQATIDPRRASSCNGEPVPPGRYPIEPVVPSDIDVAACTRAATLTLGSARQSPRPERCPALGCAPRCPAGERLRDANGCPTCRCAQPSPIAD